MATKSVTSPVQLTGFLRCPDVRKKRIIGTSNIPEIDYTTGRKPRIMTVRLPDMGLLGYPMAQTRSGVCYLSRKAGRPPSESNKISIFYLTSKEAGQPSGSNSIPHALFESSDIQTFPYRAFGYSYLSKIGNLKNPNSGVFLILARWTNVLWGALKGHPVASSMASRAAA